jgi:hypothetical protein
MTGVRSAGGNDRVSRAGLFAAVAALSLTAALLGGCGSTGESSPPAATLAPAPASIAASQFVGSWGFASYREDKDIPRTTREAKAACSNPYVIGAGPGGGIMMHLADQPQPSELAVKGGPGGQTFIGPANLPAGSAKDRQILSFEGSTFTAKWLDPTVATRYGTSIYVRCGAKGAPA